MAIIDREFDKDPQSDREQAAVGLILKYESGKIANFASVAIAGYHVEKLFTNGLAANDVLPVGSDQKQESRFSKLGEAYVHLFPAEDLTVSIGRQTSKSLLMSSSGQRAIPNTFQGITASYQIEQVKLYSHWFNKWSRRHDDGWENFATDISGSKIDHIWVNGIIYKNKQLNLEFEHLNSANFLTKIGFRATYEWQLKKHSKLSAQVGYFTSEDDGSLFVVGSESAELDDEDGAPIGTRSSNDGRGTFAQLTYSFNNWIFSTALSQFDQSWIEDNFAGDHGTNPFPTRSIIFPDFSNANEQAMMLSVTYNWQDYLPGLSTAFTYVKGDDIENSVDVSLGKAEENYREFFIKYQPKWLKGLSIQWRYHDYRSRKIGDVDGVKTDDLDNRIFIDYTFTF
ncbi:OprD family outer membrane porin [Porticoccaceae bacterium LTM1]|nr:OprD family outer membrane porin [Porticoccaceae bacterium LTM1]